MPNPSLSPRVLVTGATGAVGPAVVAEFLAAGYRVRTLARTHPPAGLLPSTIECRQGDVSHSDAVQTAMDGVDIVVHLAALLHITNPSPALRAEYTRVNVEGTQVVVDAAQQAGVKRMVLGSTIAVYGPGSATVLTEQSPPQPDTLYGESKLAAEGLVVKARTQEGKALGVALRFAGVYGPRMKGNYRRLVQQLARGRFVPVGRGQNRRTLVYDQDVAQAVLLAATHPAAAGRVYNVSDGQVHRMVDIIGAICGALGRRPPAMALPVGPVRLTAGWLEDVSKWLGRPSPIGRASIDKYVEDLRVSSEAIQSQLGFAPRYDLATGWCKTIQAMRAEGERM